MARAIIPAFLALAVVVAVAVLSSSFVGVSAQPVTPPPQQSFPLTMPTAPQGTALLVIQQNGEVALMALFSAGPKGGAVLGMPGTTLLRSGGSFVVLAQAFSTNPGSLSQPVAKAFGLSQSAVAAADWAALRMSLSAGSGAKFPEALDPQGADAGAVAAALAAASASGEWWGRTALTGQADAFRASLAAQFVTAKGSPWKGAALAGHPVEYGDGTSYFEPDVQAALAFLASTGATAEADSGN